MRQVLPVLFCVGTALAACTSHPDFTPRETDADFRPTIALLTRYDANHDGTITRAEMEAGLKADFDAADTNHDGRLDADEVAAVNAQRWSDNKSTASTIVDWNQDGFVDFNEFAATPRSLFEEVDANNDGQITPDEIQAYAGHKKPDGQGHPRRGTHSGGQ